MQEIPGLLGPSVSLHVFEANPVRFASLDIVRTKKYCSLNGCRDRRANQTVEPVVVGLLGALLPFIDASAAGLCLDEVLRG